MKVNVLIRILAVLLVLALLPVGLMSCKPSEPPVENPNENDPTPNPGPATPEVKAYKHVVVLGVDGAGAFFQKASTPFMDSIFLDGAITHRMITEAPTIGAQCWGSMLHGVTSEVHGLTNDIASSTPYPSDSRFPSIFRVIHDNDPDAKLASFSHWNPINVGIVEDGLGIHKDTAGTDGELTQKVLAYLKDEAPTLLFVQFDEADAIGHTEGYGTPAHLNKISEIDTYIADVYDAYSKLGILDDTLFIVTADHGGSGKNHGGLSDNEKYVTFAAAGKTVASGEIEDMEMRDTAAVVLYALGHAQPKTWTARVPSGLFESVAAAERPVWVDTEAPRYHETQPTPAIGSDKYITNMLSGIKLKTYLPFDGTTEDHMGANVEQSGELSFIENGYFGKALSLDNGYLSLKNYSLGKESFTLSFWIKTKGSPSDPPILSNKDWNNGHNPGFALILKDSASIYVNVGDGSNRLDFTYPLPEDFSAGWMHVLLIVDREAGTIGLCYDFGKINTLVIPDSLKDDTFDAFADLNIGQDGTGHYDKKLAASLDELMIFKGAMTQEEITLLSYYYNRK